MSTGKEWPCGGVPNSNNGSGGNLQPVEEWSVHAQLTFTPQAGNIVLTTHDGSSQSHPHRCPADSGYSSERVMSPRSCTSGNINSGTPLTGARATCSVTVAGHHTVTLTCSEVPFDASPVGPAPIHPQVIQHVCPHQHEIPSKPPPGPPPGYQPQFHHHPPTNISVHQPQMRTQPTPPTATATPPTTTPPLIATRIPAYKDAASQTSTTQVPQVVQTHLTKPKNTRALARSPARVRGRSPLANKSTASSSDGKKQPRTVHIDVYCTGSESGSSSSDDEETASTPQTVFESSKAKVMHTRANTDVLPHALMKQKRRVLSNSTIDGSCRGSMIGASGSTISTSYPSPRSSLVSHRSLASESTISSLRTTTTNHSSTGTSWKDTDLESTRSLLKCDSFDYDNSFDRLRIKEKEKQWAVGPAKLKPINSSKSNDDNDDSSSSSSDDSEEEGLAWSFGPDENQSSKQSNIRRENTVRRTSNTTDSLTKPPTGLKKSGSLSDSEASTSLRFKRDPNRNLPKSPGLLFENSMRAARFGPTVGTLRKPGHHVGPSKNPDCSCDTCKYYFEHICYRNRTRSLGDRPYES